MKKYFIFIVLISTCILIFSCKKEQNGNFTVSGYYYTTDSIPITNKEVFVFFERSTYPINLKSDMSKDVGKGYTNAVGYFSLPVNIIQMVVISLTIGHH